MQNRLAARSFAVLAGTALISLSAATVATAAPAPAPAGTPSATSTLAAAAAPGDCFGIYTSWGATCVEPNGDDQWVRDLDPNGWTTVAHVETSYGKIRECVAPAAADGWKECKYDHKEDKCVRFYLYEQKGSNFNRSSAWSKWYSTKDGSQCIEVVPS